MDPTGYLSEWAQFEALIKAFVPVLGVFLLASFGFSVLRSVVKFTAAIMPDDRPSAVRPLRDMTPAEREERRAQEAAWLAEHEAESQARQKAEAEYESWMADAPPLEDVTLPAEPTQEVARCPRT